MTLPAYLPILFLMILATIFAGASIFVASKLSPRRWTAAKLSPYECGITPEKEEASIGQERFPVKFYLVAMLFIVFDIETAFMYPWAVAYDELKLFGLIEMGVFIAILFAAYVYVWKRGALEWAE
ncbi:MAG: NADH-quinone oxidoreductase subunit A [Actinomycetota bacterium]